MNPCTKRHPNARALILGSEDYPDIHGEVLFYQEKCGVTVSAHIYGLPENETGFFGFHIHDGSGCKGKGFPDSGMHYDPEGVPHPSHAGDLPPLLFSNGQAMLELCTDRFRVKDIIGKVIIIHLNADDMTTQPSGNAGTKIACGVIQRAA